MSQGKGDTQRPAVVSAQEYAANWTRTFAQESWPPSRHIPCTEVAVKPGFEGSTVTVRILSGMTP